MGEEGGEEEANIFRLANRLPVESLSASITRFPAVYNQEGPERERVPSEVEANSGRFKHEVVRGTGALEESSKWRRMITLMTRPRGAGGHEGANRRLNNGIGADWYDIRCGTRSQHQQHQISTERGCTYYEGGERKLAIYPRRRSFIGLSLGFFVFSSSLGLRYVAGYRPRRCAIRDLSRPLPEHGGRRLIVLAAQVRRAKERETPAASASGEGAWMIRV